MVGIISSSGLGLLDSSADRLGTTQGLSTSLGQAHGSAIVNIATGNLSVQFVDETVSGTGIDLSALRTYNSRGTATDGDADRWRWVGERKVALSGTRNAAGSSVTLTAGDGSAQVFAWDATSSSYISKNGSGAHDVITWDTSTSEWVLNVDGRSDTLERFKGSTGWIASSVDASGNKITYSFNGNKLMSMTDSASGQRLDFVYDATSGKLSELRTFSKATATDTGALLKQVSYAYYPTGTNGAGLLASVTTDLTPTDTTDSKIYTSNYAYDASNRLTAVSQSDGTSVAFTYDTSSRIATVTDQTGTTTFAYSAGVTTATLGNSTVWSYTYNTVAGANDKQLLKVESQAVGGVKQSVQYTYDADGNVATMVDGRANVVNYGYDTKGNRIKEYDALGNTVTRTFNAANHVVTETRYTIPSLTAPSGAETTRYVYDTAGRLRFTVSAEGRVTETRYGANSLGTNAYGLISQSIQYAGGVYSLTGLTATDSLSETQLTTWVTSQDKTTTQLTDFGYDYRGNLNKKISYASVDATGAGVLGTASDVSEYSYSEYGQLLQTIVDRGTGYATKTALSTIAYDGLGRQISVVSETGTTTTSYSGVQMTVTNTASGLTLVSSTDSAGRLVSISSSGSSTNRLTNYYYDNAGQLRVIQDATGARSYVFYDAAGRVSHKVDALGDITGYTYDADGRVLVETSYATRVSASVLASWGTAPGAASVTVVLDATNDRSMTNTYDVAGTLIFFSGRLFYVYFALAIFVNDAIKSADINIIIIDTFTTTQHV